MEGNPPQLPLETNQHTAAEGGVVPMWRHKELKGPVTNREIRAARRGMSADEIAEQAALNRGQINTILNTDVSGDTEVPYLDADLVDQDTGRAILGGRAKRAAQVAFKGVNS